MLNWTMSSGFDIVIVILAIVAGLGLTGWIVRRAARDVDDLEKAASVILSASQEELPPREAFSAQFETVHEKLKTNDTIGRAWQRFSSTIVPLEADDGIEKEKTLVSRSTSPARYFTLESLGLENTSVNMVPAAFLAVFALIAGVGLAGALGGIAAAFAPAGADAGVSGEMMRAAIGSAGVKLFFIAIVIALFMALRLAVSWSRNAKASAVQHFCDALLDRIYFENAESAGTRRQDAMHFQTKSLQRLGEKLATSIGGTTRDAIVEGYMDVVSRMETLTKRYDDLVSAAQKGAKEAVTKAFDESVETSADIVVKRMEAVAEHLSAIPERMEQASRSLETAGANISSEQQRFAADLQATANQSVASAASAVAGNVEETIRGVLAETHEVSAAVSERLGRLPDRIEEAARTFETASSQMIEVQGTVAEETQARTKQAVEAVTGMISDAVGEVAKAVDETIANSLLQTTQTLRAVGEDMTLLPDRLSGVARALEQSSDRIAETHAQILADLKMGAREMTTTAADTIIERVNENTTGFIDKLYEANDAFEARTESLSGLFAAIERTSDQIAQTHAQTLADFKTSASEITAVTADAIAARVNENTDTFVQRLNESNDAFEARAERLSSLFAAIERTSDQIAQTHARTIADFKTSASEITAVTADAIAARVNENTDTFVQRLNESNDAFEARAERLSGLYSTLEQANERIAETHTRFMAQMQQSTRDMTAATAQSVSRHINENTEAFLAKLNESNTVFEERAQALTGLFATLQTASDRIAATHTGFMERMHEGARELTEATADTLARHVNENTLGFVDKLNESNAAFEERAQALTGLFATLQKASDRIAETHTRFMGEMQDSTRDVIAKTTSTIAAEIQKNTADVVSRLRESDDFFASRVEALASVLPQIDQTGRALAEIMERVSAENGRVGVELTELAGSLRDATGSIKQSADRFSNNLLEVQQSLDDFQKLSKETVETVGTSQRNFKESIGMQAELWQRHVERFDDVDRKLGDVFAEMASQIDTQTRLMRDQVAEMDSSLATAVTHLGELVEELNETRSGSGETGTYR
jgi:ABC-type transporter Mla subunit MlaD